MGLYVNGKPYTPPPNVPASEAATKAAETWQEEHGANVQTVEGAPFSRSEAVVVEEQSFRVTQFSDGTVRADSRLEAAPKPAPIVERQGHYTKEDLDRLHDKGRNFMRLQVGSGLGVETQAPEERNVSWFKRSER